MVDLKEKSNGRKLGVYAIVEREVDGQKKTFWPRIGSAFVNHDGSMNLILETFPINSNKIQVREVNEDLRSGPNGQPPRRRLDTVEVRP
ncbi:MAG TPA: hypothetical protein VD838_12810 [Anaeromyxobacteraceae bacterium]|nr:hypothetical protein [Anaeromyxobacteraceae bacterium]